MVEVTLLNFAKVLLTVLPMVTTLLAKLERSLFTVLMVALRPLLVAGATTAGTATLFAAAAGCGATADVSQLRNPLEGNERSSSISIRTQRRWQLGV
jgi:hypothetical protein